MGEMSEIAGNLMDEGANEAETGDTETSNDATTSVSLDASPNSQAEPTSHPFNAVSDPASESIGDAPRAIWLDKETELLSVEPPDAATDSNVKTNSSDLSSQNEPHAPASVSQQEQAPDTSARTIEQIVTKGDRESEPTTPLSPMLTLGDLVSSEKLVGKLRSGDLNALNLASLIATHLRHPVDSILLLAALLHLARSGDSFDTGKFFLEALRKEKQRHTGKDNTKVGVIKLLNLRQTYGLSEIPKPHSDSDIFDHVQADTELAGVLNLAAQLAEQLNR